MIDRGETTLVVVPRTSRQKATTGRSHARTAPGVTTALGRLGRRVRDLRLARGLTQEDAAEAARLDPKHWQDLEGARTNPTIATLVGVARALKVDLRTLFDDAPLAATSAGRRTNTRSR